MTDAAHNPDDYCYRHPDRLSFVLCEKCGRTICLECQTHVDGKVLCPDDAKRSNVTMLPVNQRPPRVKRVRTRGRLLPESLDGHPLVTYVIILAILVIFIVDAIAGNAISPHLWVLPQSVANSLGVGDTLHQPWSLLATSLTASGVLALILEGLSIWSIGRLLEPALGRRRFAFTYFGAGLGGALLAFALEGIDAGAFGALIGIATTATVLARRLGVNPTILYISSGVSLIFSLIFGSWEPVVGGVIGGAGIGFLIYFDEQPRQRRRVTLIIALYGVLLLGVGIIRAVSAPG
jgi:membrane associated rhomboid family serine protease